MKKAEIIKNGNVNLENLTLTEEIKRLIPGVSLLENKINPIEFAMDFYLWAKDNVHPIPTRNGYRLKCEDFKVKHDLRSVVKYFEENVY